MQRSARPGRPLGYAREGAGEQSLALQLAALQKAGCAQVFTDQARGAGAGRPGLNDALSQLRPGDTLVVWNLGRLGGGVKGLVDLVNALAGREAHFRSLSDDIDTQASAGRFFFHVMARLAQMERELIVERTHAGLAVARKLGRVGGRKRRMTDSKISAARRLLAGGTTAREVADNLGVSVPTLYRWLPASART
ncbi:MAG: recombinase family protein [Proteobacteria bacterium]|nr:recombinase family protein [Pseudomonadota bacterium]